VELRIGQKSPLQLFCLEPIDRSANRCLGNNAIYAPNILLSTSLSELLVILSQFLDFFITQLLGN
jgi:hypothetical protein